MNTATRALNAQTLPARSTSMRLTRSQVSLCALVVALLLSAFSIVYTKDLNRRLFIQYQGLQHEKVQAEMEWSKLLLEESTWSAQARIQQIAQQKLNMRSPTAKDAVLVQDVVKSEK